jgi:hypothetical protein
MAAAHFTPTRSRSAAPETKVRPSSALTRSSMSIENVIARRR